MLKTAKKVDNSLFPGILNIIVLGNILSARLLWENENSRFSLFSQGMAPNFQFIGLSYEIEPKTGDW